VRYHGVLAAEPEVRGQLVAMRGAMMAARRRKQHEASMKGVVPVDEEEVEKEGVMKQLKSGLLTNNPKLVGTVVYLVFCGAFWWVMTGTQGGSASYELVQNLRGALSGFTEVSSAASWFDFMENSFPGVVFPVSYYNGDGYESEHLGNVADTFMLIGAVGMRQVRAKNNTCALKASDLIHPLVKNCFGEYSSKNEDRGPYGPVLEPGTDRKFKFSDAKTLGCSVGCQTAANLNTYQGGGFFELLPSLRANTTNAEVVEKILQLKTDRWLDRQTRAVFVDFTVYSLPSKLLAVVQLWFEIKVGFWSMLRLSPARLLQSTPSLDFLS
jgi:hypothetical protein